MPDKNIFDLQGRGIVITGGGGHLGSGMALGVAAAGGCAVICDVNQQAMDAVLQQAEQRDLPGSVQAQLGDVGDLGAVERVLDLAQRCPGGVRGWVNNAYGGTGGKLGEATPEQLAQTVDSGLTQVMAATQAVAARMKQGDGGSIINVASMYGMVSPYPEVYRDFPNYHNPPAYGAAKAGVIQFTRYAACHLADGGVRVNSISPGPFPGAAVQHETEFIDQLARRVPLGRIGRPEELVGAVVFLLSDAASYVTGHNLVVDGGWSAW